MRFIKKNIATRNNQYVDIKTFFKKYLQSFLRWIYEQNNEFDKTLETEEICNFFINEVSHPLWFQLYIKLVPFRVVVETNNYIDKYKKNASKMEVEIPINLKTAINNLSPVSIDTVYKEASQDNIYQAMTIAERFKLMIPEKITEVDTTLLLQVYRTNMKGVGKNAY